VVRTIGQLASSLFETISERQAVGGVDLLGLATGLDRIDEWTGGLQPDQLWIVGARTAVGKTALALSIGLTVARQDRGVIVYSLEMSAELLVNRLLARMTDIPAGRIYRGKISAQELSRVKVAASELAELKLAIVDTTMTSDDLSEHAKRVADQSDVGLVIVDYAGILRDDSGFGETERMSRISNNIRAMARPDQLNCAVILLAQLNRASEHREDHTPQLSDLKSSGSLEQDAHVVLLPYRPYLYELMHGAEPKEVEDDAMIVVAKNREGITGATRAEFYPRLMEWRQSPPVPVVPRSLGGTK
jgi:replicative DNA helicase